MDKKRKIIAICGSTRRNSANRELINAIISLNSKDFLFDPFDDIAGIPHFNPDHDNENPPAEVTEFRQRLKAADGILICSPEYAMGVPGTMKNAIDWTVSSMEFSRKPTALITASSQGAKAHAALAETLKIIEADMSENTMLLVSYIKTKIHEGKIDDRTRQDVQKVVTSLGELIEKRTDDNFY